MTPQSVCIASSRPVGSDCIKWACENMPDGWTITNYPEDCEVFISVMYEHLVCEEFINVPKRRCYNFHPGLLPQYRGSGAFSWAIINGERECGITLHELDVNIDTGPIIAKAHIRIEPWDTAGTLYTKGMSHLVSLFKLWLPAILRGPGNYPLLSQEIAGGTPRTYYRKELTKAMDLTRWVRAFTFEGKEPAYYTNREGKKVEVRW